MIGLGNDQLLSAKNSVAMGRTQLRDATGKAQQHILTKDKHFIFRWPFENCIIQCVYSTKSFKPVVSRELAKTREGAAQPSPDRRNTASD